MTLNDKENNKKTNKWIITKDIIPSPTLTFLIPVLSIFLAFLIFGFFLLLSGYSPLRVFSIMWTNSYGSFYALSETIVKTVPLLICALGISLSFRMKLWNIGAEGQFHAGALGATWAAINYPHLPAYVLLPFMFTAGFFAGGLWALLAAIPRAYFQVNETISTLMLNYVAILLLNYFVYGPWRDPEGFNFPLTVRFSDSAILPTIFDTRIHSGILIGLFFAVIIFVVFQYTKWGYSIKVIGESPSAARYAGMNIAKTIILVMFVGGGLAGVAGMAEVSGLAHRLQPGISPGYGYTAIIIAWLARLNPFAIVVVSFLFGALQVGSFAIQTTGLPAAAISLLHGMILFFILGGEIFTYYRRIPLEPTSNSNIENEVN